MIRFGLVGAGRIGKVHAATIAANPKAKLAYVADAMPKAAEELAAKHGAKVATVEEIMKSKDVDAVLIGSPTGFHAEQIQGASNAGKAIMCEKPVSLKVSAIEETLKVVEKNKSTLMIGFNRRFDPSFAELRVNNPPWRHRRCRDRNGYFPRSRSAACRICEGFGRHIRRHDDP